MYIQSPHEPEQPITIHNANAPRIKPAKRNEVPESYRKKRFTKLKPHLYEILLYIIGFIELIRKEMTKWTTWTLNRTNKLYRTYRTPERLREQCMRA